MRKLSCILGHQSIDLIDDTTQTGSFTFTVEKCIRCESHRITVIGIGGISIKKWESKEKYEKYVEDMKDFDKKIKDARKNMDDVVKDYAETTKKAFIEANGIKEWNKFQQNPTEYNEKIMNRLRKSEVMRSHKTI